MMANINYIFINRPTEPRRHGTRDESFWLRHGDAIVETRTVWSAKHSSCFWKKRVFTEQKRGDVIHMT